MRNYIISLYDGMIAHPYIKPLYSLLLLQSGQNCRIITHFKIYIFTKIEAIRSSQTQYEIKFWIISAPTVNCLIICIYQLNIEHQYPMSNKQELMALLRSFSDNVKKFKRLLAAQKKLDQNEPDFNKIIDSNKQLLESIPKIFKRIYHSKQDNVSIDKIKKEYETIKVQMNDLLEQYQNQLKQYERLQANNISHLRKTLSNIYAQRKSRMPKPSDQESERGQVQIKMHEVNQQTLHYERMIEIKEKEINVIKGRMVDALKVQEDMKGLVYSQGDKLNIAEDNINNANTNVHQAHQNLIEGREQHISSKKKKFCIFGIVTAILLVVLIPILIKFT